MSVTTFVFFGIHPGTNLTFFILLSLIFPYPVGAAGAIQNENNRATTTDGTSETSMIIHGSVCIGRGIDSTAVGIIASVIILSVIGFPLWLAFARIRPKFRELYAVREWFPPPENRSIPLSKLFWAFLSPQLPISRSIQDDHDLSDRISNGFSFKLNSAQFPSDEQLAQRTLWHTLIVVFAWTIVGLGGALPVYLVRTPCVSHVLSNDSLGGRFSTMQDLSVFRLLILLDNNSPTASNVRIRLIIVGILAVVVVAVPSTLKFLYEFSRVVVHRRQWLDVKCGGIEMAWLSLADARGFAMWNESALKEYLLKIGLSQGFKNTTDDQSNAMTPDFALGGSPLKRKDDADLEVDIQNLFTIGETSHISQLLQERDIILNNLEVAEVQYINSFQLSTPLPSITDYEAPVPSATEASDLKHRIGRPKALRGSMRRPANGEHLHTLGSTPTTYLAPSTFYKLRDIRTSQLLPQKDGDNLATRISQRIIGTRFLEAQRGSRVFSRVFSWGSESRLENLAGIGSMKPAQFSAEQLRHGPHEPLSGNFTDNEVVLQDGFQDDSQWLKPVIEEMQDNNISSLSGTSEYIPPARPRPRRQQVRAPLDRRSTFAMRLRSGYSASDTDPVPPPHLRLQSQRPFVRPISGMTHDQLGAIYSNIREWRSRLKLVNMEIANVQQSCYDTIASGNETKGWLLVGRGLRHLPRIQMIEGRSKEDVLYDQLQIDMGFLGQIVFWCVICVILMVSCGIMVPVTGLIVSLGPGVAHYLKVFGHLNDISVIGAGLVTTLAPAFFVILLIGLTLPIVHLFSHTTGIVSASMAYIRGFKATFMLLNATYGFWLLGCGSMIFSIESFGSGLHKAQAVADGLLYITSFVIVLTFALAMIFPALWIMQPTRLARVLRRKRFTLTPRQRFRNLYPNGYDRNFVLACCYLPVTFAATFSIISPIVGLPVCLLLLLTNMAHRYLIGYVYIESPQTGGLLQLWLLRCLANLMILQPLILGLIVLTRHLWVVGGVLIGVSIFLLFCTEFYARSKLRLIQPKTLLDITRERLHHFSRAARAEASHSYTEESLVSGIPVPPARSSVASVLEMMSITLAVVPPAVRRRGALPLLSETIDDLTSPETANRTNPNAPPRLPPLSFMTHSEEMHDLLYAPELLAPPPAIWLPNDPSGVAETEAIDLFRYHGLQTILDVGGAGSV